LRLPGELRNRIYEYVFYLSEEKVRRKRLPKLEPRTNFTSIHVLATCRIIRHEASAIFWNACCIDAEDFESVLHLEDVIGSLNCSRITWIIVSPDVQQKLLRSERLEKLPSVRQVEVQVREGYVYFGSM
jgi:hypothetical protein